MSQCGRLKSSAVRVPINIAFLKKKPSDVLRWKWCLFYYWNVYHNNQNVTVFGVFQCIKSDGLSNHRRLQCLHNRSFRRKSKKISKLRVIGLCAGNSSMTGEFPAQKASNAENVSIDGVIMQLFITNTPQFALTGKLWGVCYESIYEL